MRPYCSAEYNYIYGEYNTPKPPHIQNDRRFPFIVIVYTVKGAYYVKTPDREYEIKPGEVIIIPENLPHSIYMKDWGELNWMHISCRFAGKDVLTGLKTAVMFNDEKAAMINGDIHSLYMLFNRSAGQNDIYRTAVRKDELIAGTVNHILSGIDFDIKYPSEQITNVLDRIQNNLDKSFTVAELAGISAMSVSSFEKRFKRELDQTPNEYVTCTKMKTACRMLLQSKPVAEIAYALGYSNPLYFSKAFKKQIGLSPANYKKQYT